MVLAAEILFMVTKMRRLWIFEIRSSGFIASDLITNGPAGRRQLLDCTSAQAGDGCALLTQTQTLETPWQRAEDNCCDTWRKVLLFCEDSLFREEDRAATDLASHSDLSGFLWRFDQFVGRKTRRARSPAGIHQICSTDPWKACFTRQPQ